jgi:hypothetical protein
MPPHCDSLDGPVVTAARAALAANDVDRVLPYVRVDGETEVREAFDRAMRARALGVDAQEVADRWFFETVVRIHRAGGCNVHRVEARWPGRRAGHPGGRARPGAR